jgi:hypothetical protein
MEYSAPKPHSNCFDSLSILLLSFLSSPLPHPSPSLRPADGSSFVHQHPGNNIKGLPGGKAEWPKNKTKPINRKKSQRGDIHNRTSENRVWRNNGGGMNRTRERERVWRNNQGGMNRRNEREREREREREEILAVAHPVTGSLTVISNTFIIITEHTKVKGHPQVNDNNKHNDQTHILLCVHCHYSDCFVGDHQSSL